MDKKINISWDILVKKVRWGLTPEEESAFQEWLAQDKSHEVYFERVRKVWGAEEPTSSLKSNLSKVMTHFDAYVEKEKELRRRRIMRNVYWYAACLLVVLSVGRECGSFPSMMNQLKWSQRLPKISFREEIKQLFCWPMEKKWMWNG